MEIAGGQGRVLSGLHPIVERIAFNFSDPNREIEGERSSLDAPHPFLTDRAVRHAMALAIDRDAIARDVFGAVDIYSPARNILTGIPALESPNTSYTYDLEAANALLDQAGWVSDGNTRVKDGVKLAVSYYTSISASNDDFKWYRQEIQAIVKAGWEAIGIEVQLGRLAGDDFFDTRPDNPLSFAHSYRDIQMFASAPEIPIPTVYFANWYAGPDNSNVAQQANDWQGPNLQRYVNPEYDALYEEVLATTDYGRAAELFIQMNDLIVEDFVVVPLVANGDFPFALSNRIAIENVAPSIWEALFWNIANWHTVNDSDTTTEPSTPTPSS
jgi:peptide/nickel transport system substrate-binding protein